MAHPEIIERKSAGVQEDIVPALFAERNSIPPVTLQKMNTKSPRCSSIREKGAQGFKPTTWNWLLTPDDIDDAANTHVTITPTTTKTKNIERNICDGNAVTTAGTSVGNSNLRRSNSLLASDGSLASVDKSLRSRSIPESIAAEPVEKSTVSDNRANGNPTSIDISPRSILNSSTEQSTTSTIETDYGDTVSSPSRWNWLLAPDGSHASIDTSSRTKSNTQAPTSIGRPSVINNIHSDPKPSRWNWLLAPDGSPASVIASSISSKSTAQSIAASKNTTDTIHSKWNWILTPDCSTTSVNTSPPSSKSRAQSRGIGDCITDLDLRRRNLIRSPNRSNTGVDTPPRPIPKALFSRKTTAGNKTGTVPKPSVWNWVLTPNGEPATIQAPSRSRFTRAQPTSISKTAVEDVDRDDKNPSIWHWLLAPDGSFATINDTTRSTSQKPTAWQPILPKRKTKSTARSKSKATAITKARTRRKKRRSTTQAIEPETAESLAVALIIRRRAKKRIPRRQTASFAKPSNKKSRRGPT